MSDLALVKGIGGWDLDVDGEGELITLQTDAEIVAQAVTYRLMTWLGESPYDPEAGVAYVGLVFGQAPAPGVIAYLTQIIRDTTAVATDGRVLRVDDVRDLVYDLSPESRALTITATLVVGSETASLALEVAA